MNSEVPLGSSQRTVLPSAQGLRLLATGAEGLASGKQPMPFLPHWPADGRTLAGTAEFTGFVG
ncbi:hypothetical protein ACFSJU_12000 [Paradesertivirga mongoliensis]|uniref:Uncharacterized protein n=1 Tax=Paradesertivirga mongoliensis TaxID=2100740 RepID=A0ABW4ZM09_9SPHI|nr:hypothetical protein [Pedobacter mongoliensis]